MTRALTLADRAEILKLADACADNKDGFGFAFYNASVVRFAIAISRMCAATESDDKFAHMRHPDVQRVIGQQARTNIELQLVEQLLEDPSFETTSMDMEYWSSLHDKLKAALTAQPSDVRIPTSDAQVLAMAQQFNRETP